MLDPKYIICSFGYDTAKNLPIVFFIVDTKKLTNNPFEAKQFNNEVEATTFIKDCDKMGTYGTVQCGMYQVQQVVFNKQGIITPNKDILLP